MRSFDLTMPEERNRIATDRLSDLLLCSSQTAAENLRAEGISGKVEVVGDVMVDVALRWQPTARARTADLAEDLGVQPHEYLLVTAHRAGNVDDPARLDQADGSTPGPAAPRCVPRAPAHPRAPAGNGVVGVS